MGSWFTKTSLIGEFEGVKICVCPYCHFVNKLGYGPKKYKIAEMRCDNCNEIYYAEREGRQ